SSYAIFCRLASTAPIFFIDFCHYYRFVDWLKSRKIKGLRESCKTTTFFLTECNSLIVSARSSPQQQGCRAQSHVKNVTGRGSFVVRKDELTTIHIARVAQG
ncbi:MAG: hypothetical protein ACK49X_13945, partial [Akkermansiaceae bacterium]